MNTEIIEIIGPPGVGKTTLYDALTKAWSPSCTWTYQEALLTPVPAIAEFSSWVEYRLKRILKKKLSTSVASDLGFRFIHLHPELANFCLEHLSGEAREANILAMRFRSLSLLYTDFCRYQAIDERVSDKPCIVNEGLLQKSFLNRSDLSVMSDLVNQYLAFVPKPEAVLYINTDKELIVDRLVKRRKLIATHSGKSQQELLMDIANWQTQLGIITAWMADHHVKVYTLDGALSIHENVNAVLNILESHTGHLPFPVDTAAMANIEPLAQVPGKPSTQLH
ncbi:MAG: hypothetical protein EOO04_26875 [Chitinophagaceae bacterium]|nr:MAG: hypothetical protein EOO04_26875 [Chitinophagaceae bacterium]